MGKLKDLIESLEQIFRDMGNIDTKVIKNLGEDKIIVTNFDFAVIEPQDEFVTKGPFVGFFEEREFPEMQEDSPLMSLQ